MNVLDASVILKWFLEEEGTSQALRLREEFYRGEREIVVPDLLLMEVANALRYNPSFTAKEIKEAIQTLFDIGIVIITPTYSLLAKAIDLAKTLDVTFYRKQTEDPSLLREGMNAVQIQVRPKAIYFLGYT